MDQQYLHWKVLLPVATVNLIVTAAAVLYFGL
jgi:NADH:ubiquinone oxidoreductase subunit H